MHWYSTHILGISAGSLVACISMAGTIACRMMGHAGTDSVNLGTIYEIFVLDFQAYVGGIASTLYNNSELKLVV